MRRKHTYEKASRISRVLAFLIDHFIITFLFFALIFKVVDSSATNIENLDDLPLIILYILLAWFLFYFGKDTFQGRSPGKWFMGIIVRDEKEHTTVPSIKKLFIRNILLILLPVEFVTLTVNSNKKRLGDTITKTVVLKNPVTPKIIPRILIMVSLGVLFFASILSSGSGIMKNSGAYKASVKAIEQNEEILTETGGIEGYGTIPSGTISISEGYGNARLQIKVHGKEKDVTVHTYLEKKPGEEWELIQLTNKN